MIVVLKQGASEKQIENLSNWFKAKGVEPDISRGTDITIMGLVGDVSKIDTELIEALDIVESVKRVSEPFKQANRKFHPKDTIVEVGPARIGGGYFAMIAGPCSVESEEQIVAVAKAVKESGATMLRGGAFPYLSLCFPGHGPGRASPAGACQAGNRPAHCNGNHEYQHAGSV